MTRLLSALSLLLAAALALPAVAQTVVKDGSEITFTTRQMGVPVEGRFTAWQAQLRFDPRNPATGSVSFDIDTGSASFGATETETEVKKPEWFHVVKFPRASFRSTAIKAAGPGRYEVAGQLTIKGRARDVTVPVTLNGSTATGSFALKRLAFDIGSGDWADTSIVADEVQVRFKLQLAGLPK
jgi:polyisoprenoid-binding protein YceI